MWTSVFNNSECLALNFAIQTVCTPKPECGENVDVRECPEGKECVSGSCQIKITQCGGTPVYFDFNRANIKWGERLQGIAECLKGDNVAPLVLKVTAMSVVPKSIIWHLANAGGRSKEAFDSLGCRERQGSYDKLREKSSCG